ncbi:ATP-binding cassette domain-containing protein [Hamadaea sp.]|uniref:ATP-binding cassette domain-containing protein n=1 Tax=Hamadaea sp. TaxID=2024425 RepID=UPI0025BED0A7|nr:ATP-binding cassette domain-containing protein [Hamadaea sp.]
MTPVIRADDLFCLHRVSGNGFVAALRGLTLELAPGERLLVHGPNGSGKTTLLRVLAGEIAPSAGTVSVGGVDLVGAPQAETARLRSRVLGLVDQQKTLVPELSVVDNITLQSRVGTRKADKPKDHALKLLATLGLADLAHRSPGTLSGGEAQRVAVCAAVAHSPTLVLADEPTGELDRASADAIYDLLVAATAAVGASLLVVSHDVRAARIADRVVRIRDGRLSEEWRPGQPEDLVVDDRGWVRLPLALHRVRPEQRPEGLLLRPSTPVETERPSPETGTPHPPGEVVASLSEVSLARDGREILSGLSFDVRAETWTVLKGRSGSGKTTLLRLLAGLERPDSGQVVVQGTDLSTLDRAELARFRRTWLGVAGQRAALVETLDAVANLHVAREARGLPENAELIGRLIARLGLTGVRHRPVETLSGGERQRVAVARALAAEPSIAVFDEPTSQQDEAHAGLVAATLRAAARAGAAIVVATHDPLLLQSAATSA